LENNLSLLTIKYVHYMTCSHSHPFVIFIWRIFLFKASALKLVEMVMSYLLGGSTWSSRNWYYSILDPSAASENVKNLPETVLPPIFFSPDSLVWPLKTNTLESNPQLLMSLAFWLQIGHFDMMHSLLMLKYPYFLGIKTSWSKASQS